MRNNLEQLNAIENETAKLYKELKPILFSMFPKGVLFHCAFYDENTKGLENLEWGSMEYIEELHKVLFNFQRMREGYEGFFKVHELIEKYKHFNCDIFHKDWEKNAIKNYIYCIYCITNYSNEIRTLTISNN